MSEPTSYTMKDWVPQGDGLRVVVLLDSPYDSEVVVKHPLAVDSGQRLTEWLVNTIGGNSVIGTPTFTDHQMAAAMIDRLAHHGQLIVFRARATARSTR